MRKSIIGTLVLWSSLLIATVFISVIMYFTSYIEQFAINQKSQILLKNVAYVETISHYYLTNQNLENDERFKEAIDFVAGTTETAVDVFDINGMAIISSGQEVSDEKFRMISKKVTEPVLRGKQFISMNAYRDQYGDNYLTVASPLITDGEIFGGVVFNQRIPEIKSVYAFVANRIIYVLMLVMLLSFILFGFLSIKVTSPIRRISAAVKEFSKGNFKKRVEYSSKNELGELARNINDMASSLDNLETSRKGFISDVTHELRTPLTTISGFVGGIIDGTIPKESHNEYLEVVLSESKRLSRLISNLVQVTKMENGEIKPDRTNFDISELVRQTIIKFEMIITPKNIDVSLNIPEGKVVVNADKDKISQVLINLINNAVKFTPEDGKLVIDITIKKDKAYISVENSGPGIDENDLKYIWDRFYKGDKSRGEDRTGMGLGLYIVKRIIDLHDENITVTSIKDKKTTFEFTLPVVRE